MWLNFKVLVGWYKYRRILILIAANTACMGSAVIYGMAKLDWSFIKSLYFAVTTVSTGGLQGPPCVSGGGNPQRCELADSDAVFVAFYAMFGVPLYFLTLGIFAGAIVNHGVKARHKAKLYAPIEGRDFIYATKLLSEKDSVTLTLGTCVCVCVCLYECTYTDSDRFM